MEFEYQGFATLGVNLNRQKYGPLDISNVFTSAADLKYYLTKGAHTEGVSKYWYESADKKVVPYPYEGQVLATVIDGVVNVYALSLDAEGNFQTQEIAGKIEVDGKTIKLNADGKLELVGLPTDIAGKTLVPSLVNGVLTWAEPDTSTAEGQAQEIEGLKTRAAALEATVNGTGDGEEHVAGLVEKVAALEAVDNATQAELDAYKAEVTTAIDEALQAAKDYADANDADTIYNDEEVRELISANVTAIDGIAERVGDVEDRVAELETAVEEVNSTLETLEGITHFTTKVVESVDEVTEVGVLYLIKKTDVEGADNYNEYLYIEGQGAVLIGDTATDLSGYVTIEALNAAIADFVTTQGLADAIAGKADQTTVNEALALKANAADVVANDTFDTFKTANDEAIAAARTDAVADVEAKGYAVVSDVDAELAKKIENATIAHAVAADAEAGIEAVPEGVTKEGNTLKIVVDAPTRAETTQMIADKVAAVTGGESAAAVKLLVEAEAERSTSKDEAHDAALAILQGDASKTGSVAEAKALAQKGVDDAAQVASDLGTANGLIADNAREIATVKSNLENVNTNLGNQITALETAKGEQATQISGLDGRLTTAEGKITTNSTDINTIKGQITALGNEDTRLAGLIEGLGTSKANAADVYTKGEADTAIGTAIDAKLVDVNAAIADKANTSDVNAALDLKANAADVYAKADVYTKDEADAAFMTQEEVDDRLNALINAADPEGGKVIGDVQNLVKYVEENAGEIAALVTATDANTAKLAGIGTTVTAYVNDALAAMIQPKASDEISVAEDGTLGIIGMNVNKLVQTEGDELVLNGGNA